MFANGLNPGKLDPAFNGQLFGFRERKDHPRLLATSRPICCGGYEPGEVSWGDRIALKCSAADRQRRGGRWD